MTGTFPPSVRDHYTGRFLVAPVEGGVEILFAGALFMMIERDERLPPGFFDRMVRHIMDMLTGRRTALWDEQAIFGDKEADVAHLRAMAAEHAELQAQEREGQNETSPQKSG